MPSSMRLTYTSGALDDVIHDEFDKALARVRGESSEPFGHFIAGEYVYDGALFEREDPSRAPAIASRAHMANAALCEHAVAAARDAAPRWRQTPYSERVNRLLAAAEHMNNRRIELASVISLETGKTRFEAITEVQEAIDIIHTYARFLRENNGFVTRLDSYVEGEQNVDVLRPYGVFAVIAPFNFPLALSINMSCGALLTGNTVVVKPSEEAPWTGQLVAEIMRDVQLPPGVFNLLQGGEEVGDWLSSTEIDGLAFTGSVEVGRLLSEKMRRGPYPRPLVAEMGGKNPVIVTEYADISKAAEGIARAAFGFSGQKCSACSRVIVARDVHDDLVQRIGEFAEGTIVGDPLEREAFLGPVINQHAVERFSECVKTARTDGEIAFGGQTIDRAGYFVEPTAVTNLELGHPLTRDELFLPFVTVTAVETFTDALNEANATNVGLTAGIYSEHDAEIEEFLDKIEAGVIYVNRRAGATTGAWPGTQTFCGWKWSGATGKGGLGPHYLQQFMREQSRTLVN